MRRVSIRGGRFAEFVDGIEATTGANKTMDVVIVGAADVARSYYEGFYDPDNHTAPTCWSLDTQRPANDVPVSQKQALRCMDCRQNIRGSGSYGGRACRYFQRVAIVFEDRLDEVYQLQIPASSIYGRATAGSKMPLQQYVNYIASRGELVSCILTRIYFDEQSSIPKLYFKPMRNLDNEEILEVEDIMKDESCSKAIAFTPEPSSTGKSLFETVDGFDINAT